MTYRVEVTENAEREAQEIYALIAEDSPGNVLRWFEALFEAVGSLEAFPDRCAVAPESEAVDQKVRQLLVGSYRMLFVVRKNLVYVLHVRHGARRPMIAAEVKLPRS